MKKDQPKNQTNYWLKNKKAKCGLLIASVAVAVLAGSLAVDKGAIWWYALTALSVYVILRVGVNSLPQKTK